MSLLSRFERPLKTTLDIAGHLFSRGYPVNVIAVNKYDERTETARVHLNLPAYPFDTSQRYWAESRLSSDWRFRGSAPRDVLGARTADWNPLEPRWRKMLSVDEMP